MLQYRLEIVIGVRRLPELGAVLQRSLQLDFWIVRNHLGKIVALGVGNLQNPSDIANHAFGTQRAKRDDLGDMVFPVLSLHILNDFSSPGLTEVDVEVGGRNAVRIQKTLENEIIANRVDRDDSQRIGNNAAAAGPPARADWNAALSSIVNEIPHDEEVVDKPSLLDDPDFRIEAAHQHLFPLAAGVGSILDVVESLHSLMTKLDEVLFLRQPGGHLIRWKMALIEIKFYVAALRNIKGGRQRIRELLEDLCHFGMRLQVELLTAVAHPLWITHRRSGLEAEHDFMCGRMLLFEIVNIVGCHQWQFALGGKLLHEPIGAALLRYAMVHDLYEEVVLSENVGVDPCCLDGAR